MSDIQVQTSDHVMVITLNRAHKKNAITDAMYGDFADALKRAAEDGDIHVALINADGPDFCAGNDIGMFVDTVAAGADISQSNTSPFLKAISTFPKPLVAAVRGKAIGIGTTMLLHCDLVYVADDAALRLPFIDLGLVPEAGSARLMPARIGHARAFALFAFGEAMSGAEAAALGLANAAVPADQVNEKALSAAHALAKKPPAAIAATKALMRDAGAIAASIASERDAFIAQLASPEASAAFAAFAARRKG
ncbi:enoyl-CoA hydratase-related protein [Terricaulis silvestris]|uniref:2,3-dehydroadipyl-CoA hydratase n=1 Tax=Terricaulis silvestris TaxID=2686094 RepID=A0A6I6MLD0_9CAUL|nr:enoyl-CoA hydratase-related protein [Terricaulis silvestris]QGZ93774.1 2,3-dehydroadipyl-CoA hydratase [Terricaulis silvestris]